MKDWPVWSCIWLGFLWFITTQVSGRVQIVKPYHPMYVKVGGVLQILCTNNERDELEWVRQTPETTWSDAVILAEPGSDWENRTVRDEPSGYVETTLWKKKIKLHDRGMYICRDKIRTNSFSIWVTTIKIYWSNVTAVVGSDQVTLSCTVGGFDTNIPPMDYGWRYKTLDMVKTASWFNSSLEEGKLTLTIFKPGKQDTGFYECRFHLFTNLGALTFSEFVYLDATHLPESHRGSGVSWIQCPLVVIISFLAVSLLQIS